LSFEELLSRGLAKESEAIAARGLQEMAKRRRREEEKARMLQEVAELLRHPWPRPEKTANRL
jgi:hypothetical protein